MARRASQSFVYGGELCCLHLDPSQNTQKNEKEPSQRELKGHCDFHLSCIKVGDIKFSMKTVLEQMSVRGGLAIILSISSGLRPPNIDPGTDIHFNNQIQK